MAHVSQTSRSLSVRFRGVAEIEMLFCAVVMMTVLLITQQAFNISQARNNVEHDANIETFLDAASRRQFRHETTAVEPVRGFADIRPGMPLRMHAPRMTERVERLGITMGETVPGVTVGTNYLISGPAWVWNGHPNHVDYEDHRLWFNDYAQEQHFAVHEPLDLAPVFPP